MGIKMKGISEAQAKFRRAKVVIPDAAEQAVLSHTRDVLSESLILVPKDTTALASTGRLEPVRISGPRRAWKLVFGDPGEGDGGVDYAAAVHEILSATHIAPTQAKYVEQPLMESIPKAKRNMATAMRKAVRRAFG